jgi:lysine 2,3-aminomutase
MKERITQHLRRKLPHSEALARQFFPADGEKSELFSEPDPLGEEALYSPVKGVVHKYANRALLKVSYRCAAHCQFCTRIRQIGSPAGDLTDAQVKAAIGYIAAHPEITDVILSGGDPLYTPATTERIVEALQRIASVKVIRIGTRLPLHAPRAIASEPVRRVLERLAQGEHASYVLLHVNHPDELDDEALAAIRAIRRYGLPLLAQSVFLRGVNDDDAVLERLFTTLYQHSVIPYYIYRCDYVAGLERFACDPAAERTIMTSLRKRMPGIALPTYVIDVAGVGKVPVPLDFWQLESPLRCTDYSGNSIAL